jgi:hypothetical protein
MSVNKIMVGQSESHNLMKNKLIGICCKKWTFSNLSFDNLIPLNFIVWTKMTIFLCNSMVEDTWKIIVKKERIPVYKLDKDNRFLLYKMLEREWIKYKKYKKINRKM